MHDLSLCIHQRRLERIAVALHRPRSAAIIREKSYNDESGRQDYNCGSEGADNDDDKPTAGESHRASPTPAAKGPRKGRKLFLDPDRPWSAVESDEAQDEIMEKCDFLANEMAHHAEWTECNIKYRMEAQYTRVMEALVGGFSGPVGGLKGLSEEIRKAVGSLSTTAATHLAALDCKV